MTKIVTIASGKGGVGKTTTAVNLAHALQYIGKKAIVVDANLMTPNVAIQLGMMNPTATLNRFLRKDNGLHEIIHQHECGVSFIPSSPSYQEYRKTDFEKISKVFDQLQNVTDIVLVDAPSGLGPDVRHLLQLSDELLIVANPTQSSVMDALKTIKLALAEKTFIAGIVLNMAHGGRHELKPQEVEEITGFPLLATIKDDRKFRKAGYKNLPLHHVYPRSRSAKELRNVASFLALEK
ncbi:TPA: P-loop NTPase [Candidatus Woesearchaeota archaeon]|nr:P-loop NTPase [Candidatus Woesearchaeota archaeon]